MAIDEAWSGVWRNISVNSAHRLGDRTLYQGRNYRRFYGAISLVGFSLMLLHLIWGEIYDRRADSQNRMSATDVTAHC